MVCYLYIPLSYLLNMSKIKYQIDLSEDLVKRLDQKAKELELTRAGVIRLACVEFLKK